MRGLEVIEFGNWPRRDGDVGGRLATINKNKVWEGVVAYLAVAGRRRSNDLENSGIQGRNVEGRDGVGAGVHGVDVASRDVDGILREETIDSGGGSGQSFSFGRVRGSV